MGLKSSSRRSRGTVVEIDKILVKQNQLHCLMEAVNTAKFKIISKKRNHKK